MKPPNILWICTDQQRFDTLGCTGNRFVQTPHIDALARRGVLFEHAYCQSPVCTPSRASFLTGRYPRTTRCRQNGQSIPADEVLVTRLLADAGYTCGLAGKLHISACHPRTSPATERRIEDGYAEFHWSHHPGTEWATNEYIHWLRERGVEYQRTPFRGSKHVRVSLPAEHHQTTWCAQKAINFIQAHAGRDQPWLFSLNFFDPHHPFDPPPEYVERYLDRLEEIPLPSYTPGELDHKPAHQQIDHRGAYGGSALYPFASMTEEDHRLVRAAYWAMVDLIDVQVGRVLECLQQAGQAEDTLVLFMSDHGEMLGDHGIYLKGPHFYEEAVQVPLIFAGAGGAPTGERSPAFVELVDLAPTLLELAGLPPHPGMQGRSLRPLLAGEVDAHRHREDVLTEYSNAGFPHHGTGVHATMVRTDRFKLVAVHGRGEGELYDLETDPSETTNRWSDPACLKVRCEMLQRLCDRMAWTVDPLPVRQAVW